MRIFNLSLSLFLILLSQSPTIVQALSNAQRNVFNSGIYFFDTEASSTASCGISSGGSTSASSGASGGSYTLDQVKTFASTPITSTWNISDSTVEQWFLKQSGALATITKYGLKSSNIGEITSAVKAANVSPTFFYLYTVNEGGGAGGFINHYPSDIAGGGPANATRDAEYLTSQAQQTGGTPATGGGEPADMPTKDAQNILSSLPAGSVGIVYIQATSAVTAELENLSGKTGDWTGLFGEPLSAAMRNIQSMGNDPQQGGATLSAGGCAGSVTGEGITKAINWAVMIANNDGYGYNQDTRTTGWEKWQSDPSCINQCGSFDCSSFIADALTEAGYFTTSPNFTTYTEEAALAGAGFTNVTSSISLATGAGLQPGDILINTQDHTAMYIGNGQNVAARTVGGHPESGDQTGHEIEIVAYSNFPWNAVYRATK